MSTFLSIPEEILLLSVEESGGVNPHGKSIDIAISAGILMDLAIRDLIDTDTMHLLPVKNEHTGNEILDEALKIIFASSEKKAPSYWVTQIGLRADEFKDKLLSLLVAKKVLKVENQKILWMFSTRKYPVLDNREIKEVKARIRDLVFSDEIPDLVDIVIVSIINYSSMLQLVFSSDEIVKYKSRIEQIARMDLIGQAISKSLSEMSSGGALKSILGGKTPEEKLDVLIESTKTKFHIKNEEELPDWLRKGSLQYEKTLEFVKAKNTADIYYHHGKKQYFVRNFSAGGHTFGSGE